jgi:hypothetical protein
MSSGLQPSASACLTLPVIPPFNTTVAMVAIQEMLP